jgi:23S rRNA (guanosine2251-2'-O)-methyltransferase
MAPRSAKKPVGIVRRERERREAARATVWLFGLHAVEAALGNPQRRLLRLVVTRNAAERLAPAIAAAGIAPEIADARAFPAPLDAGSVHQGAALEAAPLDPGGIEGLAEAGADDLVLLLDRVSDPHNVGAVLRSAAVFGARAVIAPERHSAPESGALAKAASGALERVPYLRVGNLAAAMRGLRDGGWAFVGLDGGAPMGLGEALAAWRGQPLGLVLGSEGEGLRLLTRELCDALARIPAAGPLASLNVSNAAAVALYAARSARSGA